MKRVYKYQLSLDDITAVQMPVGAELLHVAEQNGALCLWAMVNPDSPKTYRCFRIAGTGHDISPDYLGIHVGTVLMLGGNLVWHVFDLGQHPTPNPDRARTLGQAMDRTEPRWGGG